MHPRLDSSNSWEPTPLVRFLGDLFEELLSDAEVVSRPSLLLFKPVEAHQVFYQLLVFLHDIFLPTIVCVVRVHNLNDAQGAGDGCLSSAATDGFKGIAPRLLLRRVPTANRDRRSSQTLAA